MALWTSSRPGIRVRVLPRFPARVVASTMMSITKVGATYTFGVTFADLAEVSSISASDQDNIFVPVLNTDTDAYGLASLQTIASGLGAAPDSASFVTIGTSASLSGERVLTAGTGLSITDGGAGSTVTVAVSDAELTALAGLTSAADKVPYFTGSGTAALADFTSFGRSLMDDANAAAARTTLDAQQHSLNLDAINGLATAADRLSYWTGSGTAALTTFSAFARTLVDDADAAAARTTLGAGDVTGPASAVSGNLASYNGTTGKIIKDSTVTCDGSNSLGNIGNVSQAGYTDFTEMAAPTTPAGNHIRLYAKDKAGTSALYMKNDAGTETELGSGGGSGDIVGPASSTDNAAARFDLTTGKLLQNSALLIADTTGDLSRSGGGGIDIQGTNTNDSAAAGEKGEYIESVVTSGSAIAMTTGVAANITSISLTAGDWDVSAQLVYGGGATTSTTGLSGCISTTSATFDATPGRFANMFYGSGNVLWPGGQVSSQHIAPARLSLASTTTVYLIGIAAFTVSTLSIYGIIKARRIR